MREEHTELLRAVDPATLGARVRAARVSRGLTQTELGGEGISTGYVSRIESGARRPTLAVLETLADRLGTTSDHLLRGISGEEYDEIRLTLDYAELALETGEATDAEAQARTALTNARRARQEALHQRAQYLLGRAVEAQGRLNDAIAIFEGLEREATGLTLAECGIALVRCYRDIGDLTLAVEAGERIEQHLRETGLPACDESVRLAVTIAGVFVFRGDLNRAIRRCTEALEAADAIESPTAKAGAYWNASLARADAGNTREAIELAERALALLGEGSDTRNLARLRGELGHMQLETADGDLDAAFGHLTQAREEMTESSAGPQDIARADLGLAHAHLAAGEAEHAYAAAERGLSVAPDDFPLLRAELRVAMGQACEDVGTAIKHFKEAHTLLESTSSCAEAATVWTELAEAFERAGDPSRAIAAYRSAAASVGLVRQRPTLQRRDPDRRAGDQQQAALFAEI